MKYRTQSANVLNEADRFERILDWQLFSIEQDTRLWSDPTDWIPGVPLFEHPRLRSVYDPGLGDDFYEWEGPVGNCARPIIQLFDDGDYHPHVRCEPCGVSWADSNDECWMCGTVYKSSTRPLTFWRPGNRERIGVTRVEEQPLFPLVEDQDLDLASWIRRELEAEMGRGWSRIMNEMVGSVNRIEESLRGITTHFTIDEEFDNQVLYGNGSDWAQRYYPPLPLDLGPFERETPERLVLPSASDSAAEPLVWNPWNNTLVLPVMSPEQLGPQIITTHMPVMPEPLVFEAYTERYWRRTNLPLTERRRPR